MTNNFNCSTLDMIDLSWLSFSLDIISRGDHYSRFFRGTFTSDLFEKYRGLSGQRQQKERSDHDDDDNVSLSLPSLSLSLSFSYVQVDRRKRQSTFLRSAQTGCHKFARTNANEACSVSTFSAAAYFFLWHDCIVHSEKCTYSCAAQRTFRQVNIYAASMCQVHRTFDSLIFTFNNLSKIFISSLIFFVVFQVTFSDLYIKIFKIMSIICYFSLKFILRNSRFLSVIYTTFWSFLNIFLTIHI